MGGSHPKNPPSPPLITEARGCVALVGPMVFAFNASRECPELASPLDECRLPDLTSFTRDKRVLRGVRCVRQPPVPYAASRCSVPLSALFGGPLNPPSTACPPAPGPTLCLHRRPLQPPPPPLPQPDLPPPPPVRRGQHLRSLGLRGSGREFPPVGPECVPPPLGQVGAAGR